jgi:hypothetical protein
VKGVLSGSPAPPIPFRYRLDPPEEIPLTEPARRVLLNDRFEILQIETVGSDFGFPTPPGLIGEVFGERCPGPIREVRCRAVQMASRSRFYVGVLPTALFGPVRLRHCTFRRQPNGTVTGLFSPVPLSLPTGLGSVSKMAPAISDVLLDPFGNPSPIWGDEAPAIADFLKEWQPRIVKTVRSAMVQRESRFYRISPINLAAMFYLGHHLTLLRVISIPKAGQILQNYERSQKQPGPLVHSVAG